MTEENKFQMGLDIALRVRDNTNEEDIIDEMYICSKSYMALIIELGYISDGHYADYITLTKAQAQKVAEYCRKHGNLGDAYTIQTAIDNGFIVDLEADW